MMLNYECCWAHEMNMFEWYHVDGKDIDEFLKFLVLISSWFSLT